MNKLTRNRDSAMKRVSNLKNILYFYLFLFKFSVIKRVSNLKNYFHFFKDKFRGHHLLKVRIKHTDAIVLISYIQANSLFPDAILKKNLELANFVYRGFLDIPSSTKIEEVKKKRVDLLQESLRSNESAIDAISNLFLLKSLRSPLGNEEGDNTTYKRIADEAFAKAQSFKPTVVPISTKDVKNIDKEIKKELKKLKKAEAKIKSKKIADERLKAIDPITIKPSTVFLFASLVSSLFLVEGFLRAKVLLWYFDINTSDFFDISDYLSSSIDVIFPTLLFAVVGMLCYFKGVSRSISNVIIKRQFNEETKNWNFWLKVIAGILVIIFFVIFIYYEIFLPIFLLLFIYFICDYIMFSLVKIDKYIVNKFTFRTAVLLISISMCLLAINILNTLFVVKTGSYQNPYIVTFQDEYKKYSEHDFFLANSNYVFLLDKETKEIVVIPKTGIKALEVEKNHETHTSYFDIVRQWLQKFPKMLSNLQQSIAEIIASKSILNLFTSK